MRIEEIGKNFNKFCVRSRVLREQRIGMEIIHDIVDEGSHPPFEENSEICHNMKFENIENVFNITQTFQNNNLMKFWLKTLDYQSPSWTKSTLCNDTSD